MRLIFKANSDKKEEVVPLILNVNSELLDNLKDINRAKQEIRGLNSLIIDVDLDVAHTNDNHGALEATASKTLIVRGAVAQLQVVNHIANETILSPTFLFPDLRNGRVIFTNTADLLPLFISSMEFGIDAEVTRLTVAEVVEVVEKHYGKPIFAISRHKSHVKGTVRDDWEVAIEHDVEVYFIPELEIYYAI